MTAESRDSTYRAWMPPNQAAEFTLDEWTEALSLFTTQAEAKVAARELFEDAQKQGFLFDEMTFTALEMVAPEKAAKIILDENERPEQASERRKRFNQFIAQFRNR